MGRDRKSPAEIRRRVAVSAMAVIVVAVIVAAVIVAVIGVVVVRVVVVRVVVRVMYVCHGRFRCRPRLTRSRPNVRPTTPNRSSGR